MSLHDDDFEGHNCNVCGGPVRYGERHYTCGAAVMAATKKADAEIERERNNADNLRQQVQDQAGQIERLRAALANLAATHAWHHSGDRRAFEQYGGKVLPRGQAEDDAHAALAAPQETTP